MITTDVREAISRSVLCWLATVDESGQPNVSPKEIFCLSEDGRLIIANIASPQSAHNLRASPKVCVSLIDIFAQKGVKLMGTARICRRGDADFAALAAPLAAMAGERFPFASLFAIDITAVAPILAPSYRLYPSTTEAEQVASAMRTYGVRPAAT